MHDSSAERVVRRLRIELDLLGYSSLTRIGSEPDLEREAHLTGAAAVVWIPGPNRVEILVLERDPDQGVKRLEVVAEAGNSPDLLALRTVELLRGQLLVVPRVAPTDTATRAPVRRERADTSQGAASRLPGKEHYRSEAPQADQGPTGPQTEPEVAWHQRWAVGAGPAVLVSDRLPPMLVLSGQVSAPVARRWALGGFLARSLVPVRHDVKKYTVLLEEMLLGVALRYAWAPSVRDPWSTDISALLGWRLLDVEPESGMTLQSDPPATDGLVGGLGLAVGLAAGRGFGLRSDLSLLLAPATTWLLVPAAEAEKKKPPASTKTEALSVRAQALFALLAQFYW